MRIGDALVSAKIWVQKLLTGDNNRPKQPRKKLQIQFQEVKEQYAVQKKLLQGAITRPDLSNSTIKLGKQLQADIQRFDELHLARINENRLNTLADPLVHPVDFSIWVLYQMHSYTEEIFHYLKTIEVVEI